MSKKTMSVAKFLDTMNSCLKNSTCDVAVRDGMLFALEHVLFETGNYAGYRYLLQNEVPEGELPGVRYDEDGNILPYETRFLDTDGSRRHYYAK